jgi:hypothetical protein
MLRCAQHDKIDVERDSKLSSEDTDINGKVIEVTKI